jgi:hypothetical protein
VSPFPFPSMVGGKPSADVWSLSNWQV